MARRISRHCIPMYSWHLYHHSRIDSLKTAETLMFRYELRQSYYILLPLPPWAFQNPHQIESPEFHRGFERMI